MNISAPEQLETLTRAELLGLMRDLWLLSTQQQAEIAQLKVELARLQQPPSTSQNSSQPPSRDQKAQPSNPPARKQHGPPPGHERHVRPLVETPDCVIPAPVTGPALLCTYPRPSIL